MRTVLVTGGAGFIGSAFVRHLYETTDDRIIVLDALTYAGRLDNLPDDIHASERFEFVYGNIRNGALVSRVMAKAAAVVHFAAETHVTRSIFDAATFLETDVLGTASVVAAAVEHGDRIERFIHISTSEVYGTCVDGRPMAEHHPLEPHTPYASAKVAADRLVFAYWKTYELPVVIARPFNNYGPRQHLEKVIPRFITSALRDEPLTVHGDGSSARDWLFVEDTCRAIALLLDAPRETVIGETFNIGTSISTSVFQIAETIVTELGKSPSLIQLTRERPGQVQLHRANIARIGECCGWSPSVSFADGLIRTIAWYRANEIFWRSMLWMRRIAIDTAHGKELF